MINKLHLCTKYILTITNITALPSQILVMRYHLLTTIKVLTYIKHVICPFMAETRWPLDFSDIIYKQHVNLDI